MRFTRAGLALLGALALSSCGANGPFGLNPQPSGGFVVTSQQSGKVLTTSLANPFIVSGGSFAVQVTEPHLTSPPNVRITAWTAPGNVPCFVPHMLPGTNVFQFTADNGATQTNTPTINPCSPFAFAGGYSTSEETVTFTDNHGNTGNFYYQIANSTTGSGTGAASNTVATIALAWDGEVPTTGGTCGAYSAVGHRIRQHGRPDRRAGVRESDHAVDVEFVYERLLDGDVRSRAGPAAGR